MITFGSLFSGIGGLDLGFERAGMVCRWQVEIDPFCRQILERHWPSVPKFADVKELDVHELEPVDVIAGGFPCQPVSVAGKGQAEQDERWLWPDFERIVRDLRPGYVVVENVPGIIQRGLATVLGSLASLGYDSEWTCLSAAAAGAPHLRDRVFVIAHADRRDLRQQPRRSSGKNGKGAPLARFDGTAQPLADSEIVTEREPATEADTLATGGPSWQIFGSGGESLDAGRQWWAVEPCLGRVAHGVSNRVERLRGLGNAVVPQVATYVGQCIVAHVERVGA